MKKLTLPKNPHKGIKLYCKKCRLDNPDCKHFDNIIYRVRIHIPGTKNNIKSKMLSASNYNEAVMESIQFENELKAFNYCGVTSKTEEGNDYSVVGAILKYNQFLHGESNYAHLKKDLSKGHINEMIRFCKFFAKSLKSTKKIENMRIVDVSQKDVSDFYIWAESNYSPKTFNKCLNGVRGFFDFLIEVENVDIKNPFRKYTRKNIVKPDIESLTSQEFLAILSAVDTFDPINQLGVRKETKNGIGEKKNMYRPYLKNAFKLFLFTGCRREEVVDLKWSDIWVTENGSKFFMVDNLKVNRSLKQNNSAKKHIPVNKDLEDLLNEMGWTEKKESQDYIIFPDRNVQSITIMNDLSKAFTHYKKGAGIEKNISLKSLRKTYITWVNRVMEGETGLLTSHSTGKVLQDYYIDKKVLTAIEEATLKIKIFGETEI